jgi:stearoyl-CoA desaturase (Delta-9 desaturase)
MLTPKAAGLPPSRLPDTSAGPRFARALAAVPANWFEYAVYAAWHLACLGVFWVGVSWRAVAICVASYLLRMFGLIAGHHRYFSHRSYTMSRPMQFLMALLGTLGAQRGLLWWVASHRHHHLHSDTDEDVHSPVLRSVLYAHSGWFLDPRQRSTKLAQVPDLAKFPELVWLSDRGDIPVALFGLALFLAFGWQGFIWGFVVSTVLLWHGIHSLSSFAHTPGGSRRYPTGDYSRNKFLIAIVTLGEGWHNNHHYYPASARHGFFWWEIDLAYYGLKVLSWLGLVRDLRLPPEHVRRGELPGFLRRLQRFELDAADVRLRLVEHLSPFQSASAARAAAAFELERLLGDSLERFGAAGRELFIQVPDERIGALAAMRREALEATTRLLAPAFGAAEIARLREGVGATIDRLAASPPFVEAVRALPPRLRPPAPAGQPLAW